MNGTQGTIILTGANGGLGAAIAKEITSKPQYKAYHTLYAVRNATSATNLEASLAGSLSPSSEVLSLELTDLENIRKVAEAVNARVASGEIPRIRALILNAGFMDFGKIRWTQDGLDATFVANYLGHWLFTLLLLKSMDKNSGRIVLVSSQTHDPNDRRNDKTKAWADKKYKAILHDLTNFETEFHAIASGTWSLGWEPAMASGLRRYGAAKLFLIMMMHELQRRMNQDPALKNVCILAVDPGTMNTSIKRQAFWATRVLWFGIIVPIMAVLSPNGSIRTTKKSASHILQAAFEPSPWFGDFPKGLYLDGTERYETSAESRDIQKRALVWNESVRYAQLKKSETVLANWH